MTKDSLDTNIRCAKVKKVSWPCYNHQPDKRPNTGVEQENVQSFPHTSHNETESKQNRRNVLWWQKCQGIYHDMKIRSRGIYFKESTLCDTELSTMLTSRIHTYLELFQIKCGKVVDCLHTSTPKYQN